MTRGGTAVDTALRASANKGGSRYGDRARPRAKSSVATAPELFRVATCNEVSGLRLLEHHRQTCFDSAADPLERVAGGGAVDQHLGLVDVGKAVVVVRCSVEAVEPEDLLLHTIHIAKDMDGRPLLFTDVAVLDGKRQAPDGNPVERLSIGGPAAKSALLSQRMSPRPLDRLTVPHPASETAKLHGQPGQGQ